MTGRPANGGTRRQAPDAASPASGPDRSAKAPGIALPADLDRSLRLLDDAQLDRLIRSVRAEARRQGRDVPIDPPGAGRLAAGPGPEKPASKKPNARIQAPAVTPGQERLILAAFEAGLAPAAIAKEVRVSRATVQHVINAAKRNHSKTGR